MGTDGALDETKNNGNVQSQTITLPGASPIVQTYTYDYLNRLDTAQEAGAQGWTQKFFYDRYGNRNFAAGTTDPSFSQPQTDPTTGLLTDPLRSPVIDPLSNRVTVSAPGQGNYVYDKAGNLTKMPTGSQTSQEYAYDAENRQIKVDGGAAAGGVDYSYDGEGRRVKMVSGATATVFVYDVLGRMVAEYSNATPNQNGTRYVTADMLDTPRVITDVLSQAQERHDYMPFGETTGTGYGARASVAGYATDQLRQKFTGKERDGRTGLDYFQARYYASIHGRFMSVDPENYQARITPYDPQSWNGYAYTRNNPLKRVDKNGMNDFDKAKEAAAQIIWTLIKIQYYNLKTQFEARVEGDREYLLLLEKDNGGVLRIQSAHDEHTWIELGPAARMNSANVILWADEFRQRIANGAHKQNIPPTDLIIGGAQLAGEQIHHFATNKNSTYTPQMEEIAKKYNLDLDGAWNKESLQHSGRHVNEYHEFVLRGMQKADAEAAGNVEKFLELFEKYVKEPIRNNPDLLYRIGWQ